MASALSADHIELLVVHCSDTPDTDDLTAADIHNMHLGFGWDGVGYHHIITRDGTLHAGRPEYWQGAHVRGVNDRSLGVCLIGRTAFTAAQFTSLTHLLTRWTTTYPKARVVGHRDAAETDKTCPNFDATAWWQSIGGGTADMCVHLPIAPLYAHPDPTTPRETELLHGEQLHRHATVGSFCEVTAATDGYRGWIDSAALIPLCRAATTMITIPSVVVTTAPRVTAASIMTLSFGAVVTAGAMTDGWVEITLATGAVGYIPAHAIAAADNNDPVAFALGFEGAPYLWGGRSADGIDCSALIQLAYAACGIACPRNSGDQQRWFTDQANSTQPSLDALQRGDLLFWPGHVAMMVSDADMVHANAHHHAVRCEPLAPALARLEQATGQTAFAIRPAPISR